MPVHRESLRTQCVPRNYQHRRPLPHGSAFCAVTREAPFSSLSLFGSAVFVFFEDENNLVFSVTLFVLGLYLFFNPVANKHTL
jgi:hypothetical protein